MKSFLVTFVFIVAATGISGQELSREQKFKQLTQLTAQVRTMEEDFFKPDKDDVIRAQAIGLEAVRLMPRETFSSKTLLYGGGCYFSFTTGSHDYQKTAEIQFEIGYLSVGFAGMDYGFISDLGPISIEGISRESPQLKFLMEYRPPFTPSEIRGEQSKSHKYQVDSMLFTRRTKAIVGNSYLLRAITFDSSDKLVAFTVARKDEDNSLILYWKSLANFDKPLVARDPVRN